MESLGIMEGSKITILNYYEEMKVSISNLKKRLCLVVRLFDVFDFEICL